MGEHAINWIGTEDEQSAERMKACRARRKQYGQLCCEERDGSCAECEDDMAVALRDTPERRAKLGLPPQAST